MSVTDRPNTEASSTPEPSADFTRFPHFPALDGLRGLAVAAVLVFHGEFAWASGGFLGVSTFFTLSGFLITSLLLAEQARDGKIALGAFWVRRFRRLMPAAVAAVVLIFVAWHSLERLQGGANFTGTGVMDRLNGDLLAGLVYVANWRFAFPPEGAGYEDLFGGGDSSPAAHFWSLSIEEQFYVFFPLIAMLVLSKFKLSKTVFGGLLAVCLVASVGSTFVLEGFDRIYNGTDVRAAEILVGALLAIAFSTPKGRALITSNSMVAVAGALALALSVLSWVILDLGTDFLLTGGFFVYALVTAALICASTQASGPVVSALSTPALRWLGGISYGAYLYHWPIFRWVDEASTGLSIYPLFAVRMVLTFAFAWLSFHYLEQPFRRGERPGLKVASSALAAGVAVFFVGGMAVAYSDIGRPEQLEASFDADEEVSLLGDSGDTGDTEAVDDGAASGETDSDDTGSDETDSSQTGPDESDDAAVTTAPPTSAPVTTPPPTTTEPPSLDGPPPVMMVVGDSLGDNLYNGLARRGEALSLPTVGNATFGGCGLAIGGEIQWPDQVRPACRQDNEVADNVLAESNAEVAILVAGPVDLLPRRLSPDEEFDLPDSDAFKQRLEENYRALQDRFVDQGVAVLWVNVPCVEATKAAELGIVPGAIESVNAILESVVADAGPGVELFNLYEEVCVDGEFVGELGGDPAAREDGLHFSDFIADTLSQTLSTQAHRAAELFERR